MCHGVLSAMSSARVDDHAACLGLVWFCIHIPSMVVVRLFPSVTPFHVRFSDPTEMPADLLLFHFW